MEIDYELEALKKEIDLDRTLIYILLAGMLALYVGLLQVGYETLVEIIIEFVLVGFIIGLGILTIKAHNRFKDKIERIRQLANRAENPPEILSDKSSSKAQLEIEKKMTKEQIKEQMALARAIIIVFGGAGLLGGAMAFYRDYPHYIWLIVILSAYMVYRATKFHIKLVDSLGE